MTGVTDYSAQSHLNYIVGKTAMPALPSVWVGLFTAVGSDAGSGFTEVTGGSYARVATSGATWNAASGSAPSTISNNALIQFPQATAPGWGTVIAFGLFDASSGGNLLAWDYLGNFGWRQFSGTSASPCVLTAPAHGYANADQVVVNTEYGAESLPGLSAGSWTGLLTVAGTATDSFNVGLNSNTTGGGSVRKVASQSIPAGVQASFAGGTPGQLVLNEA